MHGGKELGLDWFLRDLVSVSDMNLGGRDGDGELQEWCFGDLLIYN